MIQGNHAYSGLELSLSDSKAVEMGSISARFLESRPNAQPLDNGHPSSIAAKNCGMEKFNPPFGKTANMVQTNPRPFGR